MQKTISINYYLIKKKSCKHSEKKYTGIRHPSPSKYNILFWFSVAALNFQYVLLIIKKTFHQHHELEHLSTHLKQTDQYKRKLSKRSNPNGRIINLLDIYKNVYFESAHYMLPNHPHTQILLLLIFCVRPEEILGHSLYLVFCVWWCILAFLMRMRCTFSDTDCSDT